MNINRIGSHSEKTDKVGSDYVPTPHRNQSLGSIDECCQLDKETSDQWQTPGRW